VKCRATGLGRSAVSFLEDAGALVHRAGKRPASVPEQLRLEQIVGERGAVERAERPLSSDTRPVNGLCDQFFAAPARPSIGR
jgi:hypothetical protein